MPKTIEINGVRYKAVQTRAHATAAPRTKAARRSSFVTRTVPEAPATKAPKPIAAQPFDYTVDLASIVCKVSESGKTRLTFATLNYTNDKGQPATFKVTVASDLLAAIMTDQTTYDAFAKALGLGTEPEADIVSEPEAAQ